MRANWRILTVVMVAIGLVAWFALRSSTPSGVVARGEPALDRAEGSNVPSPTVAQPQIETDKTATVPRSVSSDPAQAPPPKNFTGVRFRTVDASGAAVARAKIVLKMSGAPGTKSSVIRGTADANGIFAMTENFRPDCQAILVTVALANGEAKRDHEINVPEPRAAILDVGDLAIQATRTIHVLVHDRSDVPIAGAAIVASTIDSTPVRTDDFARHGYPCGQARRRTHRPACGIVRHRRVDSARFLGSNDALADGSELFDAHVRPPEHGTRAGSRFRLAAARYVRSASRASQQQRTQGLAVMGQIRRCGDWSEAGECEAAQLDAQRRQLRIQVWNRKLLRSLGTTG